MFKGANAETRAELSFFLIFAIMFGNYLSDWHTGIKSSEGYC